VIALNADGTDYEVTDDDSAEQFITAWPVLHSILETARTRMTRKMLLQRWPPGCVRPGKVTLWIWLERAYTRNLVHRAGHGRRNYPFSYCLPEKMEEFQHLPEEFVRCPELHEFKVFPTDAAELQAIIKRNEAERLGPVVPVIRPSDVLKRRRREDEEEGPFPDGEDVEPRDVG